MGVSGTLEFLSELIGSTMKRKKKKQLRTVALKVRMDCDGCALKMKKALSGLKGNFSSNSENILSQHGWRQVAQQPPSPPYV